MAPPPVGMLVALMLGVVVAGCGSAAEPQSENSLMPDAMSCADATATDIGAEQNYSAGYLYRWQTFDGCDVRLDFAMTRMGGCYEDVDDILIGWPLGTTHSHHDYRVYLRDPGLVTGVKSAKDFERDATLPDGALDSGLRQEGSELWMVPGQDGSIWLVSSDHVERWPQGFVSCA